MLTLITAKTYGDLQRYLQITPDVEFLPEMGRSEQERVEWVRKFVELANENPTARNKIATFDLIIFTALRVLVRHHILDTFQVYSVTTKRYYQADKWGKFDPFPDEFNVLKTLLNDLGDIKVSFTDTAIG